MKRLNAFSLMEMMIVLAVVAVIAAASAPMVNRKMVNENSTQSPWTYFQGANASYNRVGDNVSAIIGTSQVPDTHPRLYINTNNDTTPHIMFTQGNAHRMDLIAGGRNNNIWLSSNTLSNSAQNSITLGNGASSSANMAVSVGAGATASGSTAIALGAGTTASAGGAVAIGAASGTTAQNAVAIGQNVSVSGRNSIALGNNINITDNNEIVIRTGEQSTTGKMITLGDENTTVTVPGTLAPNVLELNDLHLKGNLQVDGNVIIGASTDAQRLSNCRLRVYGYTQLGNGTHKLVDSADSIGLDVQGIVSAYMKNDNTNKFIGTRFIGIKGETGAQEVMYAWKALKGDKSDRRLKNVGKVFEGGLAELKKLELYNYTFKDDTEKTPRVGVMAQDLKKIFPDAVTKGEDGYLRIRMEDMFYSVINAVKELDSRLSLLEKKQKQIDTLEEQVSILEKRLSELENSKK